MVTAPITRLGATIATMLRIVTPLAALCLLIACAVEPPQEEPLPLPPPAPPRVAPRAAVRAPPATNGDAHIAAATAAAAAEPIAPEATPVPAAPVWRVTRDGVIGCTDRSALIVLNQGADGAPRVLAEARAAGGCRTTFRVNEWVVEAIEGDAVRLRMTNGGPLTLWFRRSEVAGS